jgi:NADPH:quinone reductase-like Zn-dependent oxidoreductase
MHIKGTLAAFTFLVGLAPVVNAEEAMRAAVVRDGAVKIEQAAIPKLDADEVLIKVRAAGVNPVDWKRATSAAAGWIPGGDVAGVIERVGSGVTGWKSGDAVIAWLEASGAYAQYVAAPAAAIVRKPDAMSFEEAAGVPIVASTAWAAVVDSGKVTAGQRVLVQGGAGGVGSAAVQIAKARGAHVIATASQRNHEYLRSIGADELIDYQTQRFEDHVRNVDLVVNTVNAETANRSISVLKPGGLAVSIAGRLDETKCAAANVRCVTRSFGLDIVQKALADVTALATAGKYDVNVEQTYALDQVEAAWAKSREGRTRGKLVIRL